MLGTGPRSPRLSNEWSVAMSNSKDVERGLRSYEIDANTVRVNTPGRDDPDLIIRTLKSGETKVYEAQKRKAKS